MFLPATIDIKKSEKYVLSIRIFPKGLQFAISDPANGKNYSLRQTDFVAELSLLENIQRIIFELSFLSLEFKKTNVIFVTSSYDIVPTAFFDDQLKIRSYEMVHDEKADKILTNILNKKEAIIQYNIRRDCYDFLIRNLFNPIFYNHSGLLIDFFENKGTAMGMATKMVINFHEGVFDIICYNNSRLIHCLSIEEDHYLNQVYYILKVWEQCKFDQLNDYIYLAGTYDNQIFVELNKYVKNVDTINVPREVFLWNDEAQKAPLDLLSLAL